LLNQALAIRRATDDPDEEAEVLRNIASVYKSMGERQKAQDFYAQADAASSRARRRPAPAQGQDAGAAQRKMDEADARYAQGTKESRRLAAQKLEEALPIIHAIRDDRAEASTLNNLGAVYNSLGERRKAIEVLTKALPLFDAIHDARGKAATLNNLGDAY